MRSILLLFMLVCLFSTELKLNVNSLPEPELDGETLMFNLPDLRGNLISNDDSLFLNKVVFITIWGTWCPPCRSEIPTFIKLQKRYKEEGLLILAIAFEKNEDTTLRREYLQNFALKQEINYLILDGGDTSEFSDAFPQIKNVDGLPIEIFISRDGRVSEIRNGYGYSDIWAEELEVKLLNLMSDFDEHVN